MGVWSIGSIASAVQTLVDGIPTAVSGALLIDIADGARQFAEDYTGQVIGSNSIGISFQWPLVHLTAAMLLEHMNTLGADVSSFSLGDLSVSKGGQSNLLASAKDMRDTAMQLLREQGKKVRFAKAFG